MLRLQPIEPVDYLVIGHITQDLTDQGPRLGGTVAYAGLTAKALGLRVGVVTAFRPDLDITPLNGLAISAYPSDRTTTFENLLTPQGRIQHVYSVASSLDLTQVPETWRSAPIVHLGPLIQEVEPGLVRAFPSALVGITPQGWLREVDSKNQVHACEWPEARFVLERASATVMSVEDVGGDENKIDEIASASRVLAVTEAHEGCRLFWNGDLRRFNAPSVFEVDPTGAGDIFAAAFFVRLYSTRDPWEAARFATQLATFSITRPGLAGVPTQEEIQATLYEVL